MTAAAPDPGTEPARWWHVYGAPVNILDGQPDREPGVWMQATAGPADFGPDDDLLDGTAVKAPMPTRCAPLPYLGSWDHRPSNAEIAAVVPLEWHDHDCQCGAAHPGEDLPPMTEPATNPEPVRSLADVITGLLAEHAERGGRGRLPSDTLADLAAIDASVPTSRVRTEVMRLHGEGVVNYGADGYVTLGPFPSPATVEAVMAGRVEPAARTAADTGATANLAAASRGLVDPTGRWVVAATGVPAPTAAEVRARMVRVAAEAIERELHSGVDYSMNMESDEALGAAVVAALDAGGHLDPGTVVVPSDPQVLRDMRDEARRDPHARMDEPTDSESPEAPHNPDVFELRSRVRKLRGLVGSRDHQIATLAAARDADLAMLRADTETACRRLLEFSGVEGGSDWYDECVFETGRPPTLAQCVEAAEKHTQFLHSMFVGWRTSYDKVKAELIEANARIAARDTALEKLREIADYVRTLADERGESGHRVASYVEIAVLHALAGHDGHPAGCGKCSSLAADQLRDRRQRNASDAHGPTVTEERS